MKSNSSSVLRAGKRAALILLSPPWRLPRGDLGREQRLGEALVAPLLLAGPLGQLGQRPGGGRRLQLPGTGGPARRSWSCRDQRVVARQRAALDLDARGAGGVRRAGASSSAWWAGSVKVRWRAKRRAVAAGQLAGVERDRRELASARRAPRRGGRPGAGRASSRWCPSAGRAAAATRTTKRRSVSGIGSGSARIRSRSSASRSADDRARGAVHARVDLVSTSRRAGAGSRARWRSCRPGSKLVRMKRCERSSAPLASGSPRVEDQPADRAARPQKPAKVLASGWPPPAWIAPSRSQTSVSGNAPRPARQRSMP